MFVSARRCWAATWMVIAIMITAQNNTTMAPTIGHQPGAIDDVEDRLDARVLVLDVVDALLFLVLLPDGVVVLLRVLELDREGGRQLTGLDELGDGWVEHLLAALIGLLLGDKAHRADERVRLAAVAAAHCARPG